MYNLKAKIKYFDMPNKKSVKQLIKEASLNGKKSKTTKTPKSGKFSTKIPIESRKSSSLRSLVKVKASTVKRKDSKDTSLGRSIAIRKGLFNQLRDSLDELQASYGTLNDLFNNTVSAKDNTISSLLKDLRYTVDRLGKADFELRYDKASGSLFVDGEDAVEVDTPEVLSLLSDLTALFPDKSISLKIEGDADYTDEAALKKLTELNGSPEVVKSEVMPTHSSPEGDIDTVLTGVGDSRISDDVLDPASRFTCTYKDDAYSIWDKQLKTLVKVVGTPKEADALLEGLITGVTTSEGVPSGDKSVGEDINEDKFEENSSKVSEGVPVEGQEEEAAGDKSTEGKTTGEESIQAGRSQTDSKRVMDSKVLTWSDLAQHDANKLQALGFRGKGAEKYISRVVDGGDSPFFASIPEFWFFLDKNNKFTLESKEAQKFLDANEESFTKYCVSGLGVHGLKREDYFLTAYANKIRELLKI